MIIKDTFLGQSPQRTWHHQFHPKDCSAISHDSHLLYTLTHAILLKQKFAPQIISCQDSFWVFSKKKVTLGEFLERQISFQGKSPSTSPIYF